MSTDDAPKPPPWIDSDTWYALADTESTSFMNARTCSLSYSVPDGTRNGIRRRSAASSGAWAVPCLSPHFHPTLPSEIASRGSNSSSSNDTTMLEPDVITYGSSNFLFTAPHGVNLLRDGKPEHYPEDFTSYLVRAWAAHTHATCVSWGLDALDWCCQHELPLPGARDPNYLTPEEAEDNVWVKALDHARSQSESEHQRGLHLDVHGKADRVGEADCDVGVGALRAQYGDGAAEAVAAAAAGALREALEPHSYTVDANPRLQGCWRSVPRLTLTQSSARRGFFVPLQLELGYTLRKAIGRDRRLCAKVAEAFLKCAPACLAAIAPSMAPSTAV